MSPTATHGAMMKKIVEPRIAVVRCIRSARSRERDWIIADKARLVVGLTTTSSGRGRLNVEQIRLDECPRVGGLEALPAIKIDERRRIRKLLLKPREVVRLDVEPEK